MTTHAAVIRLIWRRRRDKRPVKIKRIGWWTLRQLEDALEIVRGYGE